MFRPRFIPVLLLRNNGLVKTISFKNPQYLGDPLNAVQIFNKFKSDELVILDINASKNGGSISIDLVKEIGDEAYMPFAVGGGIRTLEYAEKLIQAGAEKVVLNTAAYHQPQLIGAIADQYGRQSVIVSIDVKKNLFGKEKVWVKAGTENTGLGALEYAQKAVDHGAGELMLTSIAHEGGMNGMHLDLIQEISQKVRVPVIAHGGLGSLEHFKEGIQAGASAVAAGSFFVYSGKQKGILINYPDRTRLKGIFNEND